MDILRRRRNPNKQIFMITDGKPTCLKQGKQYYKNSFGLDRKILNRTLNLAAQCKKLKIPITTFMVATDPWLQQFVNEFTETNNGKAFFSGTDNLGQFLFYDFESGKRKKYNQKNDMEKIRTLGELKKSGYVHRSVKEELRQNLIAKFKKKETTFPGIIGYDDTVIPDTERALLSPSQYPLPRPARPGQNAYGPANDGAAG